MRAPRPTNARVVAAIRFVGLFRKVCRGGIHPAREPRAAIGTPGFAPRLKYTPNRPPCQRGLAAGKARRLGDCLPAKYRPREPAQPGIARPQMPPPGAPPKRAPPSVNGISRRNNPSVLASLGHLPLTREAKTAPTAANRADMESAPTGVAFPQGSAGRCKHRPLQRFVITHGRGHPGRPKT